jgi:RNA polymerase sigma-70 factor (ECF subfamily)
VESYDIFYTEYKGRVFAYLLRLTGNYHLSSDLTQESFTRYLSRYGRSGSNGALLYTIARNAALDALRKHGEESLRGDDEVSPAADPERQLIHKEEVDRMIAAIQKLNPIDRELVSLLATEAFSYKEIGKLLNISEANVKVKVHRARLRLKAILNDGGQ